MRRPPQTAFYMWLLALVLVVARMGDAHLHLCFDGQEAPATVHVSESAPHHSADTDSQAHNDKDVDAYGDAVAKKSGDTDTWALAAFFLLLLLLPRVQILLRVTAETPPSAFRLPLFFRPPLRAPPL